MMRSVCNMKLLVGVICRQLTRNHQFMALKRNFPLGNQIQRSQSRCFHSSQAAADETNNKNADVHSTSSSTDPWQLQRRIVTTTSIRPWRNRKELSFDVGYIDTGADWTSERKEKTPTVVAVHGSPATHEDVIPVVAPFHEKGYRVIAINLPGYEISTGVTKNDYETFSQSTPRIAEFLLDFLSSVDLREVTMLVAHSAGSLPCSVVCAQSDLVRSAMFICSPPGHKRTKYMKPVWGLRLLAKCYTYPLSRSFMKRLVPIVNKMTMRLQSDRTSHIMSSVRYVTNIDYALLGEMANVIQSRKLPVLYICSENDGLIPFKLSIEWAEKLGFSPKNFDEYDSKFKICKKAENEVVEDGGCYKKGVIFARGGHFPQLRPDTTLPILITEAEQLFEVAKSAQGFVKPAMGT